MIALLRLHGLQLRRLVGLWGLAFLGVVACFAWGRRNAGGSFHLAWPLQLAVAPLGLIAALRGDQLAWTLPVSRSRRLASQGFFTVAAAVLGSLGTMALLCEFGDASTRILRLGALSLSGLIAALVLGGIYLLIEEDETIVGWVWFLLFGAVDVGWTYWELKQPYPPQGLWVLGGFTLIAAGFYALVFLKSECAGPRPAAGFVPAPPRFPDNPDQYLPPAPRPRAPELIWPAQPSSREGGELLGISSDLRKGRTFGGILLRRGLGTLGWLMVVQMAFTWFISPGMAWLQFYLMISNVQIVQSLRTWAYFAHTPWPRSKAFTIAVTPWMSMWAALAACSLIGVPRSDATRFLGEGSPYLSPQADASRVRFSISSELGIDQDRRHALADPGQLPQEPDRMAAVLSEVLDSGYGIQTTPEVLVALRPNPSDSALVGGLDPQQGPWMKAVEQRFQPEIRGALVRRRLYDSLIALTLTFFTMLCWITQDRAGHLRAAGGMIASVAAVFAMSEPAVHRVYSRFCDAVPALTVAVLIGLSAALMRLGYRAFREWTPVLRKTPLHIKFR